MYLIRDIFRCKPGKAKDLVSFFKKAMDMMEGDAGYQNVKIMTDAVSTYWTVVLQGEVESLDKTFEMVRQPPPDEKDAEFFQQYHDFVKEGHREVWKLE